MAVPRARQRKQKIDAASGQPFGARQRQEAAQRAIPLPDSPAGQQVVPGQLTERALVEALDRTNFRVPRTGGLARSTERPNEPITAGMNRGPGAGAINLAALRSMATRREQMAPTDLAVMARWLPTLELAASRPGAPASLRVYVRRLRSQIPADLAPELFAPPPEDAA